jgi:tellurite resistance protein TehA-like permease
MLLGIVMGSTVSIAIGLALTIIVFALLPEYSDRLAEEYGPLWRSFLGMALVSGLAVASFLAELRQRAWRRYAHAALLVVLAGGLWLYWPRNAM